MPLNGYLRCFAKERERAWGWVYLSAVAALSTWDGEFDGVLRRARAGMACETQRKARTARIAIIMNASMAASLPETDLTSKISKARRGPKSSAWDCADSKEVNAALS